MAEHFARTPNVLGWQTDNELSGPQDFSETTRVDFQDWLRRQYGTLEAQGEAQGKQCGAKLHKSDDKKPELHPREAAQGVVDAVSGEPFVVSAVMQRERRKRPPAPFTTSTMQQEASKQLGFSSQRTMRTAQQLYEGVELGDEGGVGLITYMRTDSTRVAPAALDGVREFIGNEYGTRYLPEKPNTYSNRKAAQDAHEAIRPTSMERDPEQVRAQLTADQFYLYRLIWSRFVASQMLPATFGKAPAFLPVAASMGTPLPVMGPT